MIPCPHCGMYVEAINSPPRPTHVCVRPEELNPGRLEPMGGGIGEVDNAGFWERKRERERDE